MFVYDGEGWSRCSRNSEVSQSMVVEKGAQKAFEKLVSEDSWNERVKCMRVPDWMYLLFKLKSRISDSGWQDLTNLTKLARTGVRYKAFYVIFIWPDKFLIGCLWCSLAIKPWGEGGTGIMTPSYFYWGVGGEGGRPQCPEEEILASFCL